MDIRALANISGLTFNSEELGQLENDFSNSIKYIAPILEANPPDVHVYPKAVGIEDLREDIVLPSLPIEKALKNAKKIRGRHFVVPQVVE